MLWNVYTDMLVRSLSLWNKFIMKSSKQVQQNGLMHSTVQLTVCLSLGMRWETVPLGLLFCCFNILNAPIACVFNFKRNVMHVFCSLRCATFWSCRNCRWHHTTSHFIQHHIAVMYASFKSPADDSTDSTLPPGSGWSLYYLQYVHLMASPEISWPHFL